MPSIGPTMPFHGRIKLERTDETWRGAPVFVLLAPFVFRLDCRLFRLIVTAPKGTKTDFASVPRLFRWLFPPDGPWAKAAITHDILCEKKPCGWLLVHIIFWQALCECPVSVFTRIALTLAVVIGGPKWRWKPPEEQK